tara:strand:+ start:411 stop:635 length:225 start_codon:yes stop_codon:yes gene_type:complete
MRFYKVDYQSFNNSSHGFDWFTTKADAEKARYDWEFQGCAEDREYAIISVINIEPNKAGILNALNSYARHPDNG